MKSRQSKSSGAERIKFSVVIPLYNNKETVSRAIESVLNQTVQEFEIVVVNDGSTDDGPVVVARFADPRIRIINQKNMGVSAARNRGVVEAKHEFVAFLDADDEWLPGFLETIYRLIEKYPQGSVYASRYLFGMPDGQIRPCLIYGLKKDFSGVLEDYFTIAAQSDPPICASAVVVRKDALNAIGCFPPGIKSGEDLLTWARLAIRFPVVYTVKKEAVFWVPEEIGSRPGRFDGFENDVGEALIAMYPDVPACMSRSFKLYLQRWHEMKAVTSLLLQRRIDCLRYLYLACRFAKPHLKLFVMAFLACLPSRIGVFIFNRIRSGKRNHIKNDMYF